MNKKNLSDKVVPFLVILVIFGAFAVGMLWGKVQVYEKDGSIAGSRAAAAGGQEAPNAPAAVPPQRPTNGTASVDDDPVMGDENAPITMIEFSDYECPFCKRYYDQTLAQIKENFVDTGKVKIVYRDLPLSFHDPMATKEAIAANCAREQGGDTKYFEYHDEIFNRTESNGNGLTDDDIVAIATDVGLNIGTFTTCLDDPAQKDEVQKDLADAGAAGATGTPTFIIGKSTNNGEIEGDLVVGAQPYAVFEAIFQALE